MQKRDWRWPLVSAPGSPSHLSLCGGPRDAPAVAVARRGSTHTHWALTLCQAALRILQALMY